ncbi:hypothetical protein KQ313_09155 [Synechococcus sp. CS-1325]|uniref:hypothetical protein n=1 Tax=unclassified Synechococcus TaxID=2626047 RepID=UPI0021A3FB9C|nr:MULTISPECIES: hypothetical protein [unclassified Synechococcus]MCT0199845.1 hypothetical protein [Synechococcus sp. CS-1325]MCT0214138.1 hypothetical protein [Synechococcus sp. CS-1326]MCT0231395.1 hypothetical protein [Synechococcus sp. CS-1324]MCT0232468.1 hypothetical protein [Synechococcus sp. CS-1327]
MNVSSNASFRSEPFQSPGFLPQRPSPASRTGARSHGGESAPERVMAAELGQRAEPSEALSMMVSSMVRMVQAGKGQSAASRWSAS